MMERRLTSVLPVVAMLMVAACADKRIDPLVTSPAALTPGEAAHSTTPASCPAAGSPNTIAPRGETPPPVTLEDTPLRFQLKASDDDSPCDQFTYRLTHVPGAGMLFQIAPDGTPGTQHLVRDDVVTNPDGWLLYVPFPNVNGAPASVMTYKVTDAAGNTSIENYLEFTITAVNDAPWVRDFTATAFNDVEAAHITPDVQDVEVGGNVDYCILELPREGTLYWHVAVAGNEVRKGECRPAVQMFYIPKWTTLGCQVVPTSFFPKRDTFIMRAFDGELYSNVATQTIEFIHTNMVPAFTGVATQTTLEDQPVDFRLEYSDLENDVASFIIAALPPNGTLTVRGNGLVLPISSAPVNIPLVMGRTPIVTYTPNKDFVTQAGIRDRFLVKVNAGGGIMRNCSWEVGAHVLAVNDAPIVSGPATLSATRVGGGQVVPAVTTDIRVADDARPDDQLSITLRAQGGAAGGIDFVNPAGITWTRVKALEIQGTGTLRAINAALARGVRWTPNTGTDEIGELFVSINDNGSYGTTNTGPLVATKTITVNVAEDIQLLRVRRP